MTTTRKTLKQYFRQYATPTEEQFAALIDSFVHKDEDSLTQSKIDGLVQALREKVTTNEVNTLVESKVSEIVSDPNFAAAPTAHSHAVSDVEGLGARLTSLETSKTDYEAFKTLVSTFLNAVDASDTTINRWKELEAFLNGITDQDTLAGLLLQLKSEITALIPAPAPTNYLKQVADLDAYTDAQEGEIVQYVGTSTADYTRGFCYERVAGEPIIIPSGASKMNITDVSDSNLASLGVQQGSVFYRTNETVNDLYKDTYYGTFHTFGIPKVGGRYYNENTGQSYGITAVEDLGNGSYTTTSPDDFPENKTFSLDSHEGRKWWTDGNIRAHSCSAGLGDLTGLCYFEKKNGSFKVSTGFTSEYSSTTSSSVELSQFSWQPIVTSPAVS